MMFFLGAVAGIVGVVAFLYIAAIVYFLRKGQPW